MSLGKVTIETAAGEEMLDFVAMAPVGPGYFHTLRQPILAGREFTPEDLETEAPVLILGESMASRFWGKPSAAVGQGIRFEQESREVIGVVAEVQVPSFLQPIGGLLTYWPMEQGGGSATLLVRLRRGAEMSLQTSVQSLDPDVVVRPGTMRRVFEEALSSVQFLATLFSLVTLLALVLALGGVYGALNHFALQQQRQVALRIAIGATRGEVQRWLLWRGMWKAVVGVTIGLFLSYPFGRLLESQLFGLEASSMGVRVVAAALLLGAAAIASWLPAFRASNTEPKHLLNSL